MSMKKAFHSMRNPRGFKKPVQLMFGVSLQDLAKRDEYKRYGIPRVVHECLQWISSNEKYMKTEGIFRIGGSYKVIVDIKKMYDEGKSNCLENEISAHNVAGVLKLFLRELPECLCMETNFEKFLYAQEQADENASKPHLEILQRMINSLPEENQILLKVLVNFFVKLQEHKEDNKMGANNLAIVFGPTFIRPPQEQNIKAMAHSKTINKIILSFIENFSYLFEEVPDPKIEEIPENQNASSLNGDDAWTPPPTRKRSRSLGSIIRGKSFEDLEYSPNAFNAESTPKTDTNTRRIKDMLQKSVNALFEKGQSLASRSHSRRRSTDHIDIFQKPTPKKESKRSLSAPRLRPEPGDVMSPKINQNGTSSPYGTPVLSKQKKSKSSSVPPKGNKFLDHALAKLNADREKEGRSSSFKEMDISQLKKEKVLVKKYLKEYNQYFLRKNGYWPEKEDREPIRPLYHLYKEAKQEIEARETKKEREKEIEDLQQEKEKLQILLNQFRQEFVRKYGRKIKWKEDRLPVQREYDRYMEIKSKLKELQAEN